MDKSEIERILNSQREYFDTGATLPVKFRIEKLKKLKAAIKKREGDILSALKSDLGKSSDEGYMCEVGMVLSELSYMIKHTGKFAKERSVHTPLSQFPSRSYTKPTPYGNTLIMSPWNYPFLLTLGPLTDAIAAGNTAIVKPSAYSPATSELLARLIGDTFSPEHVAVVTGGREENKHLLDMKFDFVFFTGSSSVGKEVLRHSAERLTPCVLELGGKSPCIVDSTAKIKTAARRIVFGKLINCGQTCVAPDYVLCQRDVKDDLVRELISQIKLQYGDNPLENPDYGKIINRKHYDRLTGLIDTSKVVFGGQCDEDALRIAPTVMDGVEWCDPVMGEEIFGPILPVLTFDGFNELYEILGEREKPLALYLFSEDKSNIRDLTARLRYGGGCINDCVIHLATSEMGFGGVGESGMGSYHGKDGFDAFTHRKSIVKKSTLLDLPMRYQPYKSAFMKLVRLFLR